MSKELSNKPLVEAIFELKWKLKKSENGGQIDPNYKILVGMLYDRLKRNYPQLEALPASDMPDEMVPHVVQNRFRVGEGKWPLVQIGPGILTVNDTGNYTWEDFERRILEVLKILIEIYHEPENLIFNSLSLRYIDSIDFDPDEEDTFIFLKEKLHTKIELNEKLFENTGVMNNPIVDFKTSCISTKPKGTVTLRFANAEVENIPKLILETVVLALNENVPDDKEQIPLWIEEAHELTSNWFFKLIEGDLYRRFE